MVSSFFLFFLPVFPLGVIFSLVFVSFFCVRFSPQDVLFFANFTRLARQEGSHLEQIMDFHLMI